MNSDQTKDWRRIAYEEYEHRRNAELELGQVRDQCSDMQVALTATNNYNTILAQKLSELENKCAHLTSKVQHGVALLKQAKLLLQKHQNKSQTLEAENLELKENLTKKTAMLESEVLQHEKTNEKLGQALSKLATHTSVALISEQYLPAPPDRAHVDSPDVLYAEDAQDFGHEQGRQTDSEMEIEDLDSELMTELYALDNESEK